MDTTLISWIISAVTLSLSLGLFYWILRLRRDLAEERYSRRSQSVRYGALTEQFLPLAASYPWDASNFRFLGAPIDGIQFEEDRIILVEFKSGNSQLSSGQRQIRDLVQANKVDFKVIRVA